MRDSLTSTPRSIERPDSLTSSTSTSSEQWILNYPFDKVSPPQTLSRPTKSGKDSSISRTISEPGRSVKDLKTTQAKNAMHTCSSKSCPQTKTNGSLKRDSADITKRNSCSDRVRSSGSENSSLGENSLMSDFVSSIMTEISSDEFGKSCISLDSGLKSKKKSPQQGGHSEPKISPGTRSKCNSLPSNHSHSLALSVASNSKTSQASKRKVSKTQSAIAESKATKVKAKEQKCKDSLSGIPKAITEKNFKFYRGRLSKESGELQHTENSNNISEVKKREPKGRSRIPKLIRNSFKSQKSTHSDHPAKKKSLKGFSKRLVQDNNKIQMTCNVS